MNPDPAVPDLLVSTLISFAFAAVVVLIGAAVGVVLGWLLRRWTRRLSGRLGEGRAMLLGRVLAWSTFAAVVLTSLYTVGVPVGGFLGWMAGAAGILGVAIGFASQTSATNIISGIFLLGERPFEVGQAVDINGQTGTIESVDLLSVKLRTFENTYVRVPNETVMKSTIINFHRYPVRRFEILIRVRPGTDIVRIREIVLSVAQSIETVLVDPAPNALFSQVIDGAVELRCIGWATQAAWFETRGRFALGLLDALAASNVELVGSTSQMTVIERPS